MNLSEIVASRIDECVKGVPGGMAPIAVADIAKQGWRLLAEDLPLPVCILRETALATNENWMQAFLAASGARIAPHGKTTMSPQLFDRQLAHGAWAMTLATVHQVQVARHFGVERIVLANQLVGRQGLRYVLAELKRDPGLDFYCLVDSAALVERMAEAARAYPAGRPIQVLLEGGMQGGRTGVRTLAEAEAVAKAVKAAEPYLALRGVEGFEGLVSGEGAVDKVRAFLGLLCDMARMVDVGGYAAPGPFILSAGGSAFYDLVVEAFGRVELGRERTILTRSGCYITHDSGGYSEAFKGIQSRSAMARGLGRPDAAIEVWAYVQSRPEPTRALVTMGKRDVSWDSHMPMPQRWFRPGSNEARPKPMPLGHRIVGLNDQHGYLDCPADSPLAVGDMIGFGISHPCLTFDRWQLIYTVDDDYRITGGLRTYF